MLNDCVSIHNKYETSLNMKTLIEVPCDIHDKLYYPYKKKIDVYTVLFIGYSAGSNSSYIVAAEEYPGGGFHHEREFTFNQIGSIIFTNLHDATEYQKKLNSK